MPEKALIKKLFPSSVASAEDYDWLVGLQIEC